MRKIVIVKNLIIRISVFALKDKNQRKKTEKSNYKENRYSSDRIKMFIDKQNYVFRSVKGCKIRKIT
jgi:hypothetical protein